MIESPHHILVIKSEEEEINKVEKFLRDIFETHQLPDGCFNKVFLCVSEAVHNSIIHGNKQILHKQIEVQVNCEERLLNVSVKDEGEGFDIKDIPDPTHPENLKKESGRGIHIIKSISQFVTFNEKGNSMQFQIRCA